MSINSDLTSDDLKRGDPFEPYTEDDMKCDETLSIKGTAWAGSAQLENIFKDKMRALSKKYLKKIKTLQQNKRRQETRIERLTTEVRSMRDRNGVQAAYIDVLCGMLGDDIKEKFRNRQGLGILGDIKSSDGGLSGSLRLKDDANDEENRNEIGDGVMSEKDKDLYCVEDITEEEQVEFC